MTETVACDFPKSKVKVKLVFGQVRHLSGASAPSHRIAPVALKVGIDQKVKRKRWRCFKTLSSRYPPRIIVAQEIRDRSDFASTCVPSVLSGTAVVKQQKPNRTASAAPEPDCQEQTRRNQPLVHHKRPRPARWVQLSRQQKHRWGMTEGRW